MKSFLPCTLLLVGVAVRVGAARNFNIDYVSYMWCKQDTVDGVRYTDYFSKATFSGYQNPVNIICNLTASDVASGTVQFNNLQYITTKPSVIMKDYTNPDNQYPFVLQISGVCTDASGQIANFVVPQPTNPSSLPTCSRVKIDGTGGAQRNSKGSP